jgi:hypothetical protein
MIWMTAYFDAAGHPSGKHSLVVGGYISQVRTWIRFEDRWKAALKQAGETEMHLTDFISNGGKYRRWKALPKSKKAALLLQLSNLIEANTQKSFVEAVLLDDWERVNKVYKLEESHCTPYAIASYFVIDRTVRWWGTRKKECVIKFIFEDGDKHKGDFIWLMDQVIRKHRAIFSALSPIFEPKKLAPLQAADFVAWSNRRAVQIKFGDDSLRLDADIADAFAPLVKTKGKNVWGWLDEDKLLKFCRQFDVPKRGDSRVWTGPPGRIV